MSQYHTFFLKIIAFIIVLASQFSAFAQRKNLIFESTFDSQNSITQWYEQSLLHSWSAEIDNNIYKNGKGSLKVELIKGIDTSNGPRAELGMYPQKQKEYWYGFSNYFPSEFISDSSPESVAQWQARPDFEFGEKWRSPPLALLIRNGRFILDLRWSSKKVNTTEDANFMSFDLGPVIHNIWNDWVLHVKWHFDNTGTLQVWRNDSLVLQQLNHPIGFNDEYSPYLKVGIYKWDWSNSNISKTTKRVCYIDEVRVGNSFANFQDVSPLPKRIHQLLPIKQNSLEVIKSLDGSYIASFIASSSSPSNQFILYLSDNFGKTFVPVYSESISIQEGKKYNLKFIPK